MSDSRSQQQWYVARQRKRYGPVGSDKLKRMVQDGHILPTDKLWCQGFEDWVDATAIRGLFDTVGETESLYEPESPYEAGERASPDAVPSDQSPDNDMRTAQHRAYDEAHIEPGFGQTEADLQAAPHFEGQEELREMQRQDLGPSGGAATHASGGRRKKSFLRRALTPIFVLLLVVGAGVMGLSYLLSAEKIRDQIVVLVKDQTGHDMVISGKTSLSFFPNIGVKLNDVILSNQKGIAGTPLLQMAALTIDVKLIPLLKRQIEINKFILKNPNLSLLVNKEGIKNWQFELPKSRAHSDQKEKPLTTRVRLASLAETGSMFVLAATEDLSQAQEQKPQPSSKSFFVKSLSLGDVRIINGTLSYRDERKDNSQQQIGHINLALKLPQFTDPLEMAGDLHWQDEKITLEGRVDSFVNLLKDKPSAIKLTLSSAHLNSHFDGQILSLDPLTFQGKSDAQMTSLRSFMHWMGHETPPASGFGPFSFSTIIKMERDHLIFSKARFALDSLKGEGNVNIRMSGKRPYIRATLTADQLNLNHYISADGAPSAAPSSQPKFQQRDSLDELIEHINKQDDGANLEGAYTGAQFVPTVTNAIKPAPAGSAFATLRAFDGDVRLKVSKIFYQKIKIDQSDIDLKLRDALLTTTLKDVNFYGGHITGVTHLNSAGSLLKFKSDLKARSVSALPFLKDAIVFDWLSGQANFSLMISGSGLSVPQITKSLNGSGKFSFLDGAIEGLNIPQMIRSLQGGQWPGLSRQQSQKTDFSELMGTFTLDKGIATNRDLMLLSPLMRTTGEGRINLPEKSVNYLVKPKLVASLEGQGGRRSLSGVTIPVRIKGPWSRPSIRPDAGEILQDPEAIKEGAAEVGNIIKGVKKKLKTGSFESIVKDALKTTAKGEKSQGSTQKKAPEDAIDPTKLFNQLFGQ